MPPNIITRLSGTEIKSSHDNKLRLNVVLITRMLERKGK